MRGKQVFMDSLRAQGVEYIFGNPGTTENPILDALIDDPGPQYIMALFEGVALGAAHYYSQATGKTSVINLHVAPGLGNSLGMLYNAKEAGSPMVVTAGQQDTRMLLREPLLSGDLVAMARPLVKWSVQVERADDLALVLHRAFKIASDPPTGPVFVALPINVLEEETDHGAVPLGELYRTSPPDQLAVEKAAEMLLAAEKPQIVVGDGVASSGGVEALVKLAESLGAAVWYEGLHHRINFPTSHPAARMRLPFEHAGIRKAMGESDVVLLIGGSFFEELWFTDSAPFSSATRVIQIEAAAEKLAHNFGIDLGIVASPKAALESLQAAIEIGSDMAYVAAVEARNRQLEEGKAKENEAQEKRRQSGWDADPISVPRLMAELSRALPDDAVIVNEAITAGPDLTRSIGFDSPEDYYGTRGGGIGQALPGALGVKLAHPDRPVVAVSGDGSAMYSIQALWTAVHHQLGIVFVILNNREYKILKYNIDAYRARFGVDPERGYLHMDLTRPDLGFVDLAKGMGTEGRVVTDPNDLAAALGEGLKAASEGRPYLLDVRIEGLGD